MGGKSAATGLGGFLTHLPRVVAQRIEQRIDDRIRRLRAQSQRTDCGPAHVGIPCGQPMGRGPFTPAILWIFKRALVYLDDELI